MCPLDNDRHILEELKLLNGFQRLHVNKSCDFRSGQIGGRFSAAGRLPRSRSRSALAEDFYVM